MKPTPPRRSSLADQLRSFVRESRLRPAELQQLSGVPESELRPFLEGQAPPSLEAVDRLAELLGLELSSGRPCVDENAAPAAGRAELAA